MSEVKTRKFHYDILRILSAFNVVLAHCASQYWYDLDLRSGEWVIANSYAAIGHFSVPMFVMISGAIFLDKQYKVDIKKLYKHNIMRLVILYIIWSSVYGLIDCMSWGFNTLEIKEVLRELIWGRYHLWYLPMIVGIYILLPVIKSWIENTDKKTIEYFLMLFLVLQIGRETLKAIVLSDEIQYILELGKVEMVCSYVGYFVLGYYLVHVGIGEKLKKAIYIVFIPAILINIVLGFLLAWRVNKPVGTIYDSFGVFIFLITVALFVWGIDKLSKLEFGTRTGMVIKEVSANTLGVYVMHIAFIELSENLGIHSMMVPNVVGIPAYAVLCFVICALAAAILRRIPFIGRFLC